MLRRSDGEAGLVGWPHRRPSRSADTAARGGEPGPGRGAAACGLETWHRGPRRARLCATRSRNRLECRARISSCQVRVASNVSRERNRPTNGVTWSKFSMTLPRMMSRTSRFEVVDGFRG
jgi:hypothetical protein